MAEPKYDKEAHKAALIGQLKKLGVEVTVSEPKTKQATTSTSSRSSTTTSQPYKDPGKYDPFPNKGAGMGARTKPWSAEAQAIGQGSAKGVTGQRPAQQGNTMQGGFTRGPGGLPQRSGPPLGRSAGYGPMPGGAPGMPASPLGPVASRSAYQPGLPANTAQPPQYGPAGAPLGSFQAAYGRMAGQLPNSPFRPGMSMGPQEWRPPMVGGPLGMAAPTYANPLIDNQDEAWPTEQPNQQAWNPMALWSMLTGR